MIELQGDYGSAKIYANVVEDEAINQVKELLNHKVSKDSSIRMMPDIHAGKGCTIGTTMTIGEVVVPNLVGVDIGCGVIVCKLNVKKKDIDFETLDKMIRKHVPLGFKSHSAPINKTIAERYIENMRCRDSLKNISHLYNSVGTLGGGNHYIELNEDSNGNIYLTIHSGSRNLGQQVATHYQNIAIEQMKERNERGYTDKIEELKSSGRHNEIEEFVKDNKPTKLSKKELDLAWLSGGDKENYLHDMELAQLYANLNRNTMANIIVSVMGWGVNDIFQTIHNYIETNSNILRKGAISAYKDEKVIVPLNMRDGSILAKGKGNKDWNYSAPHGAGRIMGRKKALANLSMEDFEKTMSDANIYTTSVSRSTLDEAPMVYKKPQDILDVVEDTLDIIDIIKPIYNLKG